MYNNIKALPLSGNIGAEIEGVELSNITPDICKKIYEILLNYHVVCFRNLNFSLDEYSKFISHFGEFGEEPYIKTMDDHPEIIQVIKEAHEEKIVNFGGHWHSDWSQLECPPKITCLYAMDIPPYGGDTIFTNLNKAYIDLPFDMKEKLSGKLARHTAKDVYGLGSSIAGKGDYGSIQLKRSDKAHNSVLHPVVRTHPETGNKSLYVNPVYTKEIMGLGKNDDTLNQLFSHIRNENYTCRVRWQMATLVMWDNRCTNHLALNDYDGFRRETYRITLAGDKPF